jgi:diguanylate cyclase (GGDEF)-like protein
VAQTMLKSIRIADRLGRFGGEEFVIFLPESDSKGANHLAERIRKIIANLIISAPDVDFSLTVSIGVATYQNHQSLEDVIKRADDALYQAKNQGRNRVVMAESDQP